MMHSPSAVYWRQLLAAPLTIPLLAYFHFLAYLKNEEVFDDNDPPRIVVWLLLPPFLVLDVVYNVVVGTWLYWELPKELLFTQRCIRHRDMGDEQARVLCAILNDIDPGHCDG